MTTSLQELEMKINYLLSMYDKTSPNYRFCYIFYNIAQSRERPLNFPIEIWNKAIQNAPSNEHLPIIIKGLEGLEERKIVQERLMRQINESSDALFLKYEDLKKRCEIANTKIRNLVTRLRKLRHIDGDYEKKVDFLERLYFLKGKILNFERVPCFIDKKDQITEILWTFKQIGENMKKELLHEKTKHI